MVERLENEVNVTKHEKVDITKESLEKILGRMSNWKSPGPDLVQRFWLKNFSSLYGRVRSELKECLDSGLCLVGLLEKDCFITER